MNLNSGVFFIDFEGFQHGDEDFRLKELCLMDASNPLRYMLYVFKPDCEWECLTPEQQRTYTYCTRHLHELSWNEGLSHFCSTCFGTVMRDAFKLSRTIFYVIGTQKAAYLRRILPGAIIVDYSQRFNVTLKGLPRASPFVNCIYRNHGREHCAMIKCYRLYLHYARAMSKVVDFF